MTQLINLSVSLQPYNTMAVPATANYFAVATSVTDIKFSVEFATLRELSLFVIGEGSNTIFTDDYQGLVVHNNLLGKEIIEESNESVLLNIAAGENWHRLVSWSVQQGWYGLENLALIPGLVGAAPIQNIGAYGAEVKDVLEEVTFFDITSKKMRTLNNQECEFAYRDSIFKQQLAGKVIITAITLRLNKQADLNIDYPALQNHLAENQLDATLENVFQAVCAIRQNKLPMPEDIPNAGSFFNNPIVDPQTHIKLKTEHPEIASFEYKNKFKIAAAWLIEQAGWKGKTLDGVQVHQQHALVIVNPEMKSGAQVIQFANAIQKDIKEKFGLELVIEPKVI